MRAIKFTNFRRLQIAASWLAISIDTRNRYFRGKKKRFSANKTSPDSGNWKKKKKKKCSQRFGYFSFSSRPSQRGETVTMESRCLPLFGLQIKNENKYFSFFFPKGNDCAQGRIAGMPTSACVKCNKVSTNKQPEPCYDS